MIIQIVSQSLVTHMKNSLILEELKWFNLVNGSGTFPTPAQVPFLSFSYLQSSEHPLIMSSGEHEEKIHEESKGKITQRNKFGCRSEPLKKLFLKYPLYIIQAMCLIA